MKQDTTQEYIEEMGLHFEGMGLPRTAGRILGWLLICDPPEQSMVQLMDTLQVSKSNISTTARMLIQMGLLERVSFPADRKDYFRMRKGLWSQAIQSKMKHLTHMRLLAEKGLDLMQDASEEQCGRLQEMYDIHEFFEREYPKLLARWERERNKES